MNIHEVARTVCFFFRLRLSRNHQRSELEKTAVNRLVLIILFIDCLMLYNIGTFVTVPTVRSFQNVLKICLMSLEVEQTSKSHCCTKTISTLLCYKSLPVPDQKNLHSGTVYLRFYSIFCLFMFSVCFILPHVWNIQELESLLISYL